MNSFSFVCCELIKDNSRVTITSTDGFEYVNKASLLHKPGKVIEPVEHTPGWYWVLLDDAEALLGEEKQLGFPASVLKVEVQV